MRSRSSDALYRRFSVYRRLVWRVVDVWEPMPGDKEYSGWMICILSLSNEGEVAVSADEIDTPLSAQLSLAGEPLEILKVSFIERRRAPYASMRNAYRSAAAESATEPVETPGALAVRPSLLNPEDELILGVVARTRTPTGNGSSRPALEAGGSVLGDEGAVRAGRTGLGLRLLTRFSETRYSIAMREKMRLQ